MRLACLTLMFVVMAVAAAGLSSCSQRPVQSGHHLSCTIVE